MMWIQRLLCWMWLVPHHCFLVAVWPVLPFIRPSNCVVPILNKTSYYICGRSMVRASMFQESRGGKKEKMPVKLKMVDDMNTRFSMKFLFYNA